MSPTKRQLQLNLRMTPEERRAIEDAARRLNISVPEAARLGIGVMSERIAKSGTAANKHESEFIQKQVEWGNYLWRVVGGTMSYDEAIAECGKQIVKRLEAEGKAAQAQAEEMKKWKALYGHQEEE